MATLESVAASVREFLMTEVRPGAPADAFPDTLPLVSSGVMDSVAIARLVTFLEERYPVEFMAYELDVQWLDTVQLIAKLVFDKLRVAT
ncbi:MAG: hypothetical protein ABMA64_25320 [Myxococcota bacterium]